MAAPVARFRQSPSAPGLIETFHESFGKVADSRRKASATYSMCDALKHVPSDTQMREILDAVPPQALLHAFEVLHPQLQRGKTIEPFSVFPGHYLLAVDSTGQFSSNKASSPSKP